jgi:hypothetical protein
MSVEAGTGTSGYSLYTGVQTLQPLGFNLNKEKTDALGYKFKTEPEYKVTINKDGKDLQYGKLRVYEKASGKYFSDVLDEKGQKKLADYNISNFFDILISDRDDVASTGKFRIINNLAQHTYAVDIDTVINNPKMDWFSRDGIRIAKEGEVYVMEFLQKWLNVGSTSKCFLQNWNNLVNGNTSEIDGFIVKFRDSRVRQLLTVEQNKETGKWYQKIYPRCFDREMSLNYNVFKKHFDGNTSKVNYQNSFDFKVFNEPTDSPDDLDSSDAEVVFGF